MARTVVRKPGAGIWILSVGALVLPDRRRVGRFLVLGGFGVMALSVMTMFGIHSLAVVLADVALVFLVWIGWVVASRP